MTIDPSFELIELCISSKVFLGVIVAFVSDILALFSFDMFVSVVAGLWNGFQGLVKRICVFC